jgi:mannose-6-phosphate isomerase
MCANQVDGGLPLLKLTPLFKPRVWGGRRFASSLGRELPDPETPFGESWELADIEEAQSVVADGPFAGTTLGALREKFAKSLLGSIPLLDGRFPLLLKFIDASERLSVQVHPGPEACAALAGKGAREKTECWYVMARDPGAVLYVGLEPGVDRKSFEEALSWGDVERLLHRREVEPGDFVYLPAGTVHAVGKGILLAEVQQSSDTTYRFFDWNRVGLDGVPRDLHIEEALASIHFSRSGSPKFEAPPSGRRGVSCAPFEAELLDPAELRRGCQLSSKGFIALMGVHGYGTVHVGVRGASPRRMVLGETLLVPACLADTVVLRGDGALGVLSVTA